MKRTIVSVLAAYVVTFAVIEWYGVAWDRLLIALLCVAVGLLGGLALFEQWDDDRLRRLKRAVAPDMREWIEREPWTFTKHVCDEYALLLREHEDPAIVMQGIVSAEYAGIVLEEQARRARVNRAADVAQGTPP